MHKRTSRQAKEQMQTVERSEKRTGKKAADNRMDETRVSFTALEKDELICS